MPMEEEKSIYGRLIPVPRVHLGGRTDLHFA